MLRPLSANRGHSVLLFTVATSRIVARMLSLNINAKIVRLEACAKRSDERNSRCTRRAVSQRRNRRLKMIRQKWIRVDPVNKVFDILRIFFLWTRWDLLQFLLKLSRAHLDKVLFFRPSIDWNFTRRLAHSLLESPLHTCSTPLALIRRWVTGYRRRRVTYSLFKRDVDLDIDKVLTIVRVVIVILLSYLPFIAIFTIYRV